MTACGKALDVSDVIIRDVLTGTKTNGEPDVICERTVNMVVGNRVYCPACALSLVATPGIYVSVPLDLATGHARYDGYSCGDALPVPKVTIPASKAPGYGGPARMAAWLPGGAKWTGEALTGLGWDVASPHPKRKPAAPSVDAAAVRVSELELRVRDLEALLARQRSTIRIQAGVIRDLALAS